MTCKKPWHRIVVYLRYFSKDLPEQAALIGQRETLENREQSRAFLQWSILKFVQQTIEIQPAEPLPVGLEAICNRKV